MNAVRVSQLMSMVGLALVSLTLAGCSYLFYPKASTYLDQAKGPSGPDTVINLVGMLEHSAAAARSPQTYDRGMDELHNQLHALDEAYCQFSKPQTDTPAYGKAATLRRELWTIFKPLWRHRDKQAVREAHLDLLTARLQEVRDTVQVLKK